MKSLRLRMALWFTFSVLVVLAVFVGITHLHLRHELQQEKWERANPGQPGFVLHGNYSDPEINDIVGELTQSALFYALPVALLTGSVAVPKAMRVRAVGAGLLELGGVVMLTITFALGPPTVAGVTTSQFGTFAVILGFVLLHERPKPNQWVGIVCTIAGVSLLAAVV